MSHFNEVANEWDNPQKVKLMQALATNAKKHLNLSKNLKIMDFGAGTGLFGLEFIDYADSLLGIDVSEGMLKVMEAKTSEYPKIKTKLIDLESEELDEKFDLIVSSMAFHHLTDPKKMAIKLARMLNPKGKLVIVDLDKEDGTFHPDNEGMGVKHFGFDKLELETWNEDKLQLEHHLIHHVEKNEKSYPQFMLVLSKN
jgi:ubiquinone/menaquinone biosynthesis C-methylase UbiE